MGGQAPEQYSGDGHHEYGELQSLFPPVLIADKAKDHPAQRTHEVPGGKDPVGLYQAGHGIVFRKKRVPIMGAIKPKIAKSYHSRILPKIPPTVFFSRWFFPVSFI